MRKPQLIHILFGSQTREFNLDDVNALDWTPQPLGDGPTLQMARIDDDEFLVRSTGEPDVVVVVNQNGIEEFVRAAAAHTKSLPIQTLQPIEPQRRATAAGGRSAR